MDSVSFVVGFVCALILSFAAHLLFTPTVETTPEVKHIHTWNNWYSWGIMHQAHRCSTCGWEEVKKFELT